jgi:hypothetical protein
MSEIRIRRILNEDNRVGTVILYPDGVFDLYKGLGDDDCFYITEHGNPNKIVMAITTTMYHNIFEVK